MNVAKDYEAEKMHLLSLELRFVLARGFKISDK
jgi:hypothetical protein